MANPDSERKLSITGKWWFVSEREVFTLLAIGSALLVLLFAIAFLEGWPWFSKVYDQQTLWAYGILAIGLYFSRKRRRDRPFNIPPNP